MPLSDLVTVNITTSSAAPTREGFGVPLIAALVSSSIIPGRTLAFASLTEMVSAGFAVGDPAYLCASKVFSQNPSVSTVKVGKRVHSFTSLVKLTCAGIASTLNYVFTVGSTKFTVAGTGSANGDAAAITTAVGSSVTNCVASNSSSPDVLLSMTAGKLVDVKPDTAHMKVTETTTDAGGSSGIADDLAAIAAVDNDWYGLLLDSNSPAEIAAAAAWVEANGPKLFVTNSIDSAIYDGSSTTDIAYVMKGLYARTALLFSGSQLLSYSGAAWMGNRFPFDPGSDTWAFKTLAGVPADNLSSGQIHAIEAKNANVYTPLAGLNVTQFGKTTSGEFIDVTRFVDWLRAELQVQIFGVMANNPKIPFTDAGIDTIRATIAGVLQEGIDAGGLAKLPAPIIVTPTAASVNAIDKAARNLPNVKFSATLAGAIHSLVINGTLSV